MLYLQDAWCVKNLNGCALLWLKRTMREHKKQKRRKRKPISQHYQRTSVVPGTCHVPEKDEESARIAFSKEDYV